MTLKEMQELTHKTSGDTMTDAFNRARAYPAAVAVVEKLVKLVGAYTDAIGCVCYHKGECEACQSRVLLKELGVEP